MVYVSRHRAVLFLISGVRLPKLIGMFVDQGAVEEDTQGLPSNVDRGSDILVRGFGRSAKAFPKDIQLPVAPNEAQEMVATPGGLRAAGGAGAPGWEESAPARRVAR